MQWRRKPDMAMGENTRKVETIILTNEFIIQGRITIPANMRVSDALNKFLKNQTFIPVTNTTITVIKNGEEVEGNQFILINKEQIVGIIPQD